MSKGALNRYGRKTLVTEILVIVLGLVFISPLFLMLGVSFKTAQEAYLNPFGFGEQLNWENYVTAFLGPASGSGAIGRALLNSSIITVCTVAILITVGSFTAYVLARHLSRWAVAVYLFFAVAVVLPEGLGLIPLYSVMRLVGLTDSLWGMILLFSCILMPVAVFLYVGFIRVLPRDYEEAARVDGSGWFRTFVFVVFPLLRPITASTAILTALLVWNNFFVQLVFLNSNENQTLPVAINSLASQSIQQWNIIFAGVVISIIPVLVFFVFMQKAMVRGFSGGIRG